MPELPEVEVVRRGLDRWVVGRTVAAAWVGHPRAVRRHRAGAEDFMAVLPGLTVLAACRRGKYLWLPLGAGRRATLALVAHLGMSGQMLVQPAAVPPQPHLRARLTFADGDPELRFVDQRTFGGLAVETLTGPTADEEAPADGAPADGALPVSLARIARDVVDPRFDQSALFRALRRRRTGVKRALLDQSLVSGIGNIYADEALWEARLRYTRPTETLTRAEVGRLVATVRAVMADALAAGGTSFDRLYVNVNGDSGYFDRSLRAYGRAGQPCLRCATPIRREAFMNRSSFFCPRCQPRPRRARP